MSNPESTSTDEFSPIESQDELNRIVSARVARERAKFADYDDLKAAAAGVETLKAEHAAALEAAKAEKDTADAEVARLNAEVLKLSIASEKGVPAKLLTGSTKEELEASAKELLEFKGAGNGSHAHTNGPMFGLEGADAFASRDAEARLILGL
ncbi:scaffolding protein [Arthrobacter phage BaileyBlu]|uniref:Scaffolding protein n=1 Tax=Arthrobacter phage BaileyBlu TaxID=2910754 RepID=A0AA49BNH1_9CAUD|nr:head scaffolding protein [Arthrobacter phage BaileyBlu]UJQ87144.1 scaffolding protein [Arthrobacter phage BaileyBlu]